ncbi:MAG: DEAD/DEAH box helicase [Pseudomonadota bacterium]
MQDFSSLPKTLSSALSQRGFDSLTPVQEAVSNKALVGKDLLVSAQTGSGKTVGFGLAMAGELLDDNGKFDRPAAPLAVVIAPTRELALQVGREFDWLFAGAGIVTASAVGGMDVRTERRALERGAHVVVATPGRLRDHTSRGVIDLKDLRTVVLDEADEMLDMGFAEDLEYILDQTPATRRTLMFSATVPRGIAKLAQTYQKEDAQRLKIGSPEAQHSDIAYSALTVSPSDVEKAIVNLLRYHDAQTAIVFANTRSMVARLTAKFSNRGFAVVSLSGELSQSERTNAMQALRDGRAQVCVATDVAARGIDLPGLELVIHADLPSNADTLLHRSGRTGRAGRKGTSILIVPGRHRSKAQRLLKMAKLEAAWGTPPSADEVLGREEDRIISNPALNEPPNVDELAFAERLLKGRSPEQIAAAYLRLYRERHSAPEILGTAPEPGKPKQEMRAAFGPSTWFSLSLGRKHRAEPRWLLPMLCRNAGLSKDAIGAIRVSYQETFVEIATDAVPAMKRELGNEMTVEHDAKLTELAGVPDFDASPKGPPAAPHSSGDAVKRAKPPKPARSPEPPNQEARTSPSGGKSKGTSAAGSSKKQTGKNEARRSKSRQAPPTSDREKSKPQPATGTKTRPKRDKQASDTSVSLRARKPNSKGGSKSSTASRSGSKAGKGGEAKPFRKPSKRN